MKSDLNCVWAPRWVERLSLAMPTRDLNVAERGEHCVGDVVDGDAVDRNEHVFRVFAKWPGKVQDVFDGGWLSVKMMCRWDEWEAVGCENMDVI